jgi:hypothetical protein
MFLVSAWLLLASSGAASPPILQGYASAVQHDSSTLTLYADNTFTYESRGDSCWLWHDRTGTWSKQGDLLYLTYTVNVDDSRDGVQAEGTFGDQSRILVVVTDPLGAPVRDVLVTFNGQGYESRTGPDGRAFVDYEDIPESSGAGWCKSKKLEQLILKRGSTTTSYPLETPLANYFEVVVEAETRSHVETDTARFHISGRKLTFLRPEGETAIWVDQLRQVESPSP